MLTFHVAGAGIMPKFSSTFTEKWKWITKGKKGCSVQGYEPYSKNATYSYPVTIGIYQETLTEMVLRALHSNRKGDSIFSSWA